MLPTAVEKSSEMALVFFQGLAVDQDVIDDLDEVVESLEGEVTSSAVLVSSLDQAHRSPEELVAAPGSYEGRQVLAVRMQR